MKKIVFAALVLIAGISFSFSSFAWFKHGNSSTCVYGSALADGCPGAPVGGSYRLTQTQFQNYAQVNGLTFSGSLGSHPQTWNVACIDYACGIPSAAYNPVGYTLTSQGLKDASVQANWTKDGMSNCVPNNVTHIITCGVVANPNIVGYDFSYTASGCIRITFNANVTGTVTIDSSYFRNSDGATLTTSNCDVTNGNLINGSANANITAFSITNSVIDGNASNFPFNFGQVIALANAPNMTFTMEYVACIHLAARCTSNNNGGNKTKKYNIFLGLTYPANGTFPSGTSPNYKTGTFHGEVSEDGTSGTSALPIEHDDFNVILMTDENGTTGNRNTAVFYLTDGTHSATAMWSLFTVNNNTIVAPPSDGVNPGSATLASSGTGYAANDVIYTTPTGCGVTGPGLFVSTVAAGVVSTFTQGMTSGSTGISGNGHCTSVPSNPVAQNTTTGVGTGATFNFSGWAQQSISAVFEGDGIDLTDVEIKNNYVAVVQASTIVSTARPPCLSFATAPSGTVTTTGNVNWVTGLVMSLPFSTGTVACT